MPLKIVLAPEGKRVDFRGFALYPAPLAHIKHRGGQGFITGGSATELSLHLSLIKHACLGTQWLDRQHNGGSQATHGLRS